MDHLFADDFRHNFRMPLKSGLEGFKDIDRMMNSAFPDVVVTELDLIATDDKVVELSQAKGSHNGEFMGIKATSRPCEWTEIHIYKIIS